MMRWFACRIDGRLMYIYKIESRSLVITTPENAKTDVVRNGSGTYVVFKTPPTIQDYLIAHIDHTIMVKFKYQLPFVCICEALRKAGC